MNDSTNIKRAVNAEVYSEEEEERRELLRYDEH